MTATRSMADELRLDLADPHALAESLGLERSREERHKWRCPAHGGTSLSLRVGPDRTLQARCFGCDLAGDALTLIAAVEGLDLRRDFRAVLRRGAELAGRWDLVADLEDHSAGPRSAPPVRRPAIVSAPSEPEPGYPPAAELAAVLDACVAIAEDADACAMLTGRGLDVERIDELRLAYVLPLGAHVPPWAASWQRSGHRVIVPVVDALGVVRSVRAWRLTSEQPKRVAPRGFRATGLVYACPFARAVLASNLDGFPSPLRVIIAEGEPDSITWATRFSDADEDAPVVLGVVAGAWSAELARRVPDGAHVVVRTHHDRAGDAYADAVAKTLRERCRVLRAEG